MHKELGLETASYQKYPPMSTRPFLGLRAEACAESGFAQNRGVFCTAQEGDHRTSIRELPAANSLARYSGSRSQEVKTRHPAVFVELKPTWLTPNDDEVTRSLSHVADFFPGTRRRTHIHPCCTKGPSLNPPSAKLAVARCRGCPSPALNFDALEPADCGGGGKQEIVEQRGDHFVLCRARCEDHQPPRGRSVFLGGLAR
jgi:hypothetical protein